RVKRGPGVASRYLEIVLLHTANGKGLYWVKADMQMEMRTVCICVRERGFEATGTISEQA
ncbi:hypothetical protein, partial [Oceanospirillum multiglobuliferum]|uniref:hypothetical protein n=1 Tax=Oceanospirillum multiglobuliferum TaxID=64969 RepID=UPI001B80D88F